MSELEKKARELVEKFIPHAYTIIGAPNQDFLVVIHAKECAIICVEEKKNTLEKASSFMKKLNEGVVNEHLRLNQLIEEIKKL